MGAEKAANVKETFAGKEVADKVGSLMAIKWRSSMGFEGLEWGRTPRA